jgi:hypothetical protein
MGTDGYRPELEEAWPWLGTFVPCGSTAEPFEIRFQGVVDEILQGHAGFRDPVAIRFSDEDLNGHKTLFAPPLPVKALVLSVLISSFFGNHGVILFLIYYIILLK